MIKIDGVDIPTIKYIDPVDGEVDILRVMLDGVQIWPAEESLQIPTGITLVEVFDGELQIPTGISLEEIIEGVPNIPTGIQTSEYEVITDIDWDLSKMYLGEGGNTNLVTLYFTGKDADVSSIPAVTDWVLDPFNVVNTVTVYTDRVELLVNTPFTSASSVTIDYTPGVNPLKDIDGHLLTALNDQALENLLVPSYTYLLDDYPGAAAAYSLRKLRTGVVQGIMVRRDSDDQLVDVRLYDDPSKSIDLDSITESGGQTLSEWVGGASAYIQIWYDQSGNGNNVAQPSTNIQPLIISGGTLLECNSKSCINNDLGGVVTANGFLWSSTHGIEITINMFVIAVSKNGLGVSDPYPLYSITIQDDNNTGFRFHSAETYFRVRTLTSNNDMAYTNNIQSIYSCNYTGTSLDIKANNTTQSFPFSTSLDTSGKMMRMFSTTASGNKPAGDLQEVIIYQSDQSANRTGIETNINDHYNIYVVTAEVDAQLIQADNDGLSNTVLEINGLRSSASDAAVANLISRNVTVITN